MPKISIIVPVYKVEKYLNRCLDSIIAQTYTDWECILIDDGSPDNSGKICDEYAEKDSRFVVIHQENTGSAEARNIALKNANGEYIICVDSDDWVENNYLEQLYNVASVNDADVVGCNLIREYPRKSVVVKNLMPESNKKCLSDLLTGKLQGYLHLKLIKRTLLVNNNIQFVKDINLWEDMIFSVKVFYYAEKIFSVDIELYHYRYNPVSLVNTYGEARVRDLKCAVDEIEKFLFDRNVFSHYYNDLLSIKSRVKCEILLESKRKIQRKYISIYPEVDKMIKKDKTIPYLKRLVIKLFMTKHFILGNLILKLIKMRRILIRSI